MLIGYMISFNMKVNAHFATTVYVMYMFEEYIK
jgi:hypothetical protein